MAGQHIATIDCFSPQALMSNLVTYWHTLRHLKPIQLYGRICFRLLRPHINLGPAPPLRLLENHEWWEKPARRRMSLIGPACFRFLNKTHEVTTRGWDDPSLEKLWRYNLHYFDDLNAKHAERRIGWHQSLLLRWVQENPPAVGTGWEPYPISLRIVNWIKWALGGNRLSPECIQSLAVQTRWLARRVEFHLLGNHLFANAKALVFSGLFFNGSEARNWLEKGLNILQQEVKEQILSDGGHFERSTLYHSLALEDMLDLCNLTSTFANALPSHWQPVISGWKRQVSLMSRWLAAMCHPDGEISFFNDAAIDIAPTPFELKQYAARLGFKEQSTSIQSLTLLADSGYVRIEQSDAILLLDVAPVGPDYLPAHAHADTLSFELSLFGQRVFVNSGTSCYGNSNERQKQRGTAAHNTVTINGQNSTEVWSGFRVARRAHPIGLDVAHKNNTISAYCSHDGYRRLPGKNIHHRRWSIHAKSLTIEDEITGSFYDAVAYFHLHPEVKISTPKIHEGEIGLQLPQGKEIAFYVKGGRLSMHKTFWHPRFGVSEPNFCLSVNFQSTFVKTEIKWQGSNM